MFGKRNLGSLIAFSLIAAMSLACQSNGKPGPESSVGVAVKPTPQVKEMAQNPTPPANAKKVTGIGSGKMAVDTANSADDVDFMWAERIDVDGDGKADDVQILYDNEDGVLYLYTNDDVPCKNGGTATAALLMCVYCKGNPANKPVGSGWCLVQLDAQECGAQASGMYGCRFDANGNPTSWAAVVIDAKHDDIIIATGG